MSVPSRDTAAVAAIPADEAGGASLVHQFPGTLAAQLLYEGPAAGLADMRRAAAASCGIGV